MSIMGCRLLRLDGANVLHGLGVVRGILPACHGLFSWWKKLASKKNLPRQKSYTWEYVTNILLPSTSQKRSTNHGAAEGMQYLYVCIDKEGQSCTLLNVLHADAVPWNSPSDDQLDNIILKAIFKVLISGQVCMGPLRMR